MSKFPYVFTWRAYPKMCKGELTFWDAWTATWGNKRAMLYKRKCRVLARGAMNSALVEFESGQREVISRNAIRKVKV